MARRTNYGFEKRKKEKEKQERALKKRERRLERKEAEEAGKLDPDFDPSIVPIDPADLGLADPRSRAQTEDKEDKEDKEEEEGSS